MPPHAHSERRTEPSRSEILDREKRAIAQRLACVCQTLPTDEFEALITRIAEIEIKYRLRRTLAYPHES